MTSIERMTMVREMEEEVRLKESVLVMLNFRVIQEDGR